MKQFIKKGELKLIGSGYLTNSKEEPVTNDSFVDAQLHAEYVITFAEKVKDKDFKGKKADSLEAFKNEIRDLLYGNKVKSYIASPSAPKRNTSDKLKEEALSWIEYQADVSKIEKVNKFLNHFNIISEYEEFGIYFSQPEQPVKLNKIYTIEQIVKATESVIDLL